MRLVQFTNRRRFLTHELGHIIGLSHPFSDVRLRVPGTLQSDPEIGDTTSVMDYQENAFEAFSISQDDKLMLRKLYPPNGCGHTGGFETIQ